MKTETIQININPKTSKPQYLTEILEGGKIPSKSIFCKTLTGTGATYSEIKADRNSIIVEPNVPVIKGKLKDSKHTKDNLFGVHEGVYTKDVVSYLEKTISSGKRIKIFTTPESLSKVMDAFEELELHVFSLCFFLFDEAHKIIKDVDYREDIALPMDYFFQFDEKAFVSATPIIPSDPRFREQNFKIIELEPTFDYTIPIKMVYTNNVLEYVKRLKTDKDTPICYMVNSTDMIYSFMEQLKVKDESAVFCAKKSVDKLKLKKFKCAYEDWDISLMKKHNFFTSRFFNAVDIELPYKPIVVLITEIFFADHTTFDPAVDVIQAIGRFRNGTSNIVHLFNADYRNPYHTKENLISYINGCEEAYKIMSAYYDNATTQEARDAFRDAKESLPYNKMLTKSGKKDYFKIDNYIDEALLKSHYRIAESVFAAYRSVKRKDVSRYKINGFREEFPLGDYERLKRENKSHSLKEKRKEIVNQLEQLGEIDTELKRQYWNDLYFADSFIVNAYDLLGKAELDRLDYSKKKIKEAMILLDPKRGIELIQLVKNSFEVGKKYTREHIKTELKRLYALLDLRPPKAITGMSIKDFFYVKDAKIGTKSAFLIVAERV